MHPTHSDTKTPVQATERDVRQPLVADDAESTERARRREATRNYVERVDRYLARPDMPRQTSLPLRYSAKI